MKFTVFYDSYCPLCMAEIRQLQALNTQGLLVLEDIHADDFAARYSHIDLQQADRVLHGQFDDGRMLYGLDVTVEAWHRVGKYRWLKLLRLPLIRYLSDAVYFLFARYRHRITRLVTREPRCKPCEAKRACDTDNDTD